MTPEPEMAAAASQAAASTTESISLLEQAIGATKQTDRSRTEDLLRTLVGEALQGQVTWDKNVTQTIKERMRAIDAVMSKQLAAIMHAEAFQKLEGSWRGLHYLVFNSETSASLKIKVLNVSKKDLFKDLDKAVEFDQSQMFKKLYENEFGTPGGEPYGAMIGDYEFDNSPQDVQMLSKISNVAAAAFCPFIAASRPSMFGMEQWTDLSKPRDLEKVFETPDYAGWKGYRESEDSRFVVLTMPRVLSRLPYGSLTSPVEQFNFEEAEIGPDGKVRALSNENYTWMNASFVMGARLTESFAKSGFCTAIRGTEGGGKVENLPAFTFTSDDGDVDLQCPTEIGITDRREAELSKLGFLPLAHYKNTDYAVFFGAQSTQKPKKYDRPEAAANAEISARLPYLMATSRFAHFLKVIARDKIGSFMEA
ncbi:MAG: type VI secretion system contractile sheath large subunit, partial [Planctomycetia bacterium]